MNKEEEEECVCPVCKGEGIVCVMESVTLGEAQMAPLGTRLCDCQLTEEESEE